MKYLAVLALTAAALYSYSAQLPCTIDINGVATCAGGVSTPPSTPQPAPTPTPTPTPAPTPQPVPYTGVCNTPYNVVMQQMFVGGSNNVVFDSRNYVNTGRPTGTGTTYPMDTIQVFPIPQSWPDGLPLLGAGILFTSHPGVNLGGATYEVSISRCKGDFSYYKSAEATVHYFGHDYQPCGLVSGADMQMGLSTEGGSLNTCKITPNEQWYMNWRVLNCPTDQGATCGQTFYIPRG